MNRQVNIQSASGKLFLKFLLPMIFVAAASTGAQAATFSVDNTSDNGGPTQTRALLAGSPAIDKGNGTGTDQSGLTRPVDNPMIANASGGNGADIGAVEVRMAPTAAATASITGRVMTATGRGIRTVQLRLTDFLVEDRKIRFVETERNEIYVCPISIKQILELVQVTG